jgi:trans-aconitate methyltransferase
MTEPAWVTATRTSYDAMAAYDPTISTTDHFDGRALDRALLATFAACVVEAGGGPVLDVGCGPGNVTRVLAELGLDAAGVDLSPGMIALARAAYPELSFSVADLRGLTGEYAGLLLHHSLVHMPWDERPAALRHLTGLLSPGGHLMVVWLVGDDSRHVDAYQDLVLDLTWYRQHTDTLADMVTAAGLEVRLTAARPPDPGRPAEERPQGWLLTRRP